MATLIKCIECGKQVSSDAHGCPHCGKNPRPFYCTACNEICKPSDAHAIHAMHKSCYAKYRAAEDINSFSCPTCNRRLAYSTVKKWSNGYQNFACPGCGQPVSFSDCTVCHTPVADHCGIFMFHNDRTGYNGRAHPSCVPNIYAERRTQGLCEVCGSPLNLSLWGSLLGHTRHPRCR